MQQRATLYARSRGVHTAALADGENIIVLAEDVGRHNTIDKVRGACLIEQIDPRDKILCAGRISSGMITGGVHGLPIVARTSPTSYRCTGAQWNITLAGYVRTK
jgi:FdhD protein